MQVYFRVYLGLRPVNVKKYQCLLIVSESRFVCGSDFE